MSPLTLRIFLGLEDPRLEEHIRHLEACKSGQNGSAGISPGEELTLAAAYQRLDVITRPDVLKTS